MSMLLGPVPAMNRQTPNFSYTQQLTMDSGSNKDEVAYLSTTKAPLSREVRSTTYEGTVPALDGK